MERYESGNGTGKALVHRWGAEYLHQWIFDRGSSGSVLLLVHRTALLFHADKVLYISKNRISLLPGRSLLLCQPSPVIVNLGRAAIEEAIHQYILPGLWQQRSGYCNVAELHGLPLLR